MRRNNSSKINVFSSEDELTSESLGNDETQPLRRNGCRNKKNYFQNLNKTKRNSGKLYVTAKSKIVCPRKILCKPCCLRKCAEKITYSSQRHIFKTFWKLASFNKQNVFLNSTVKKEVIKRRRPRKNNKSPRKCHLKYYLTHDNVSTSVCKKFFQNTLNISDGRLARALKRDDFAIDLRGKSHNSRRKTDSLLLLSVKEHILSFPAYSSHYTRAQNPNKKYLNPDLNIRKMYGLYVEKFW